MSLGNGDGISKLMSENTEGSAQAPQLPRKKDKRDFPVCITGIWWLVVTNTVSYKGRSLFSARLGLTGLLNV